MSNNLYKTYSKQKVCRFCQKTFLFIHKKTHKKKRLFCSSLCREKQWRKNNFKRLKEYYRNYQRKNKKPLYCLFCKKEISICERKSGKQFCSQCARNRALISIKKIQDKFRTFKENIGCQACRYDECGDCLDFHHLKPENKKIKISKLIWFYQKECFHEEVQKCILLCSNCHRRLHFILNRLNKS